MEWGRAVELLKQGNGLRPIIMVSSSTTGTTLMMLEM